MTKIGNIKGKVTNYEVWVSPGKEQTLGSLVKKFGDRVVLVDAVNNRVLILKETHG